MSDWRYDGRDTGQRGFPEINETQENALTDSGLESRTPKEEMIRRRDREMQMQKVFSFLNFLFLLHFPSFFDCVGVSSASHSSVKCEWIVFNRKAMTHSKGNVLD